MNINLNVTVRLDGPVETLGEKILESLLSINQKLNTMNTDLQAIKDKLAAQSTALGTIGTNVAGITTDVKFLKDKLAGLAGGATAAEIAELSTAVDSVSTQIDTIGATTAALDAETDSTATA